MNDNDLAMMMANAATIPMSMVEGEGGDGEATAVFDEVRRNDTWFYTLRVDFTIFVVDLGRENGNNNGWKTCAPCIRLSERRA